MNFELGQHFVFHPFSQFDAPEEVTIVGLRKHGHAKLSNGWTVDEDGIAEGTGRQPGGRILIIKDSIWTCQKKDQ